MKIIFCSALFLLLNFALPSSEAATDKVVCYYGSWATYRQGNGKFDVEHIDTRLCTHVIYTFVGIKEDGSINILDSYNDLEENYGKGSYKRLQKLKEINPKLKTIIAIGGWNEMSGRYSHVMNNDALRAKFVQNAVDFTLKHGFDGFDLDWEYPNQRDGNPYDVENHAKVLKELREAFDKHGLLLTAAVASAEFSASKSYNIPALSKYLDFIHVMTYDLHGEWDKVTGHNSPLYPSSADVTEIQKQLNIVACINFWISKGADPAKIILGIGTYGRSFTLSNAANNGIGVPTNGGGESGPYTNQRGIIGYNEIVELQNRGGWEVIWDNEQQVPHMIKGDQWIGYDDPASIKLKVEFAKKKALGGVMIWSLETDDFHGLSGVKFPLLQAINSALGNNIPPEVIPSTTTTSTTTTATPITSDNPNTETTSSESEGNNDGLCKKEGFVRDPVDCSVFYYCQNDGGNLQAVRFHCGNGLYFDTETNTCNYKELVKC